MCAVLQTRQEFNDQSCATNGNVTRCLTPDHPATESARTSARQGAALTVLAVADTRPPQHCGLQEEARSTRVCSTAARRGINRSRRRSGGPCQRNELVDGPLVVRVFAVVAGHDSTIGADQEVGG